MQRWWWWWWVWRSVSWGLYTVSSGASGCSPPLSRDEGAPQPDPNNFIHYCAFHLSMTFSGWPLPKKSRYSQLRNRAVCVIRCPPHGAFFLYSKEPVSSTPICPPRCLFEAFLAHLYCLPLASVKADRNIFWHFFQSLNLGVFWAFYN